MEQEGSLEVIFKSLAGEGLRELLAGQEKMRFSHVWRKRSGRKDFGVFISEATSPLNFRPTLTSTPQCLLSVPSLCMPWASAEQVQSLI